MNLSQIKSDALAATQGEWTYSKQIDPLPMVAQVWKPDGDSLCELWVSDDDAQSSADARHIANMDPPTTIALVEEVERLRDVLTKISDGNIAPVIGERWAKDGTPSKHDKCIHSRYIWEDCDQCLSDFARQALGEDNER